MFERDYERNRAFTFADQWQKNSVILKCLTNAIAVRVHPKGQQTLDRVLRVLSTWKSKDLVQLLKDADAFALAVSRIVEVAEGGRQAHSSEVVEILQHRWTSRRATESYLVACEELRGTLERSISDEHQRPVLVHVSGSALTGLCSIDSDVDVICDALGTPTQYSHAINYKEKKAQQAFLLTAQDTLHSHGPLAIIDRARVPILKKFGAPIGGKLDWDLSCQLIGVVNSRVVRQYVDTYPIVQPLCMLVKDWGQATQVINAPERYLSSYAMVLLVLHYLQTVGAVDILPLDPRVFDLGSTWPVRTTCPAPPIEDVARHLEGFFRYYVFEFDHTEMVVSITTGEPVSKADLGWDASLGVQDPVDGSWNVCHGMYLPHVLTCVHRMYLALWRMQHEPSTLFGPT